MIMDNTIQILITVQLDGEKNYRFIKCDEGLYYFNTKEHEKIYELMEMFNDHPKQ